MVEQEFDFMDKQFDQMTGHEIVMLAIKVQQELKKLPADTHWNGNPNMPKYMFWFSEWLKSGDHLRPWVERNMYIIPSTLESWSYKAFNVLIFEGLLPAGCTYYRNLTDLKNHSEIVISAILQWETKHHISHDINLYDSKK
jgi:hypothetical protein